MVDLAAARREAGVDDVLTKLAKLDTELVGLAPVKTRISEIAALLLVDRMRARFGVTAPQPTLHMCFTGNPGTGETTVALRMADLLHRLGYLRKGHLVSVTRDDMVGQYVGRRELDAGVLVELPVAGTPLDRPWLIVTQSTCTGSTELLIKHLAAHPELGWQAAD